MNAPTQPITGMNNPVLPESLSDAALAQESEVAQAAIRRHRQMIIGLRLLVLVVVLGGWELAARHKWIDPFFDSMPSMIWAQIAEWVRDGTSQGPLWQQVAPHRLHGDCHLGNLLWQDSRPFFLDFDDLVTGPAVQDVWMVVRGRDDEAVRQRELLLTGYEQMRAFDRSSLRLIEPLASAGAGIRSTTRY